MRKKQHFSQSLPRGELWTVRRLALAHTVTEICTTSFVNFVILICTEGAKILTISTCTCAKETTFFTISTSWWTLNCPSFSSSSYGYWDMHHFICQFCHTDLYAEGAKILTISTCTCAKETTFFTISTSWWTLNCPSFSSSSYGYWDMHHFICQFCHTDLYAEGAKILTISTCTCAKETTFFTISTSWWTLNCPSFSSSSYGYWDMHHFICQFCHTDLYAKILTISTCTCAKETTFFTISTSWWTLNCPSFSSSSYGYWDMHHFICQFCHTDLYAEGAKILTISTCTCAKETTFFTISTSWCNSVTVWARAKRRTVQSSPRGRDCEKCCFFRTRASWNC